jgi:hypothetical protein
MGEEWTLSDIGLHLERPRTVSDVTLRITWGKTGFVIYHISCSEEEKGNLRGAHLPKATQVVHGRTSLENCVRALKKCLLLAKL